MEIILTIFHLSQFHLGFEDCTTLSKYTQALVRVWDHHLGYKEYLMYLILYLFLSLVELIVPKFLEFIVTDVDYYFNGDK